MSEPKDHIRAFIKKCARYFVVVVALIAVRLVLHFLSGIYFFELGNTGFSIGEIAVSIVDIVLIILGVSAARNLERTANLIGINIDKNHLILNLGASVRLLIFAVLIAYGYFALAAPTAKLIGDKFWIFQATVGAVLLGVLLWLVWNIYKDSETYIDLIEKYGANALKKRRKTRQVEAMSTYQSSAETNLSPKGKPGNTADQVPSIDSTPDSDFVCPSCKNPNPPDSLFCIECGKKMPPQEG